METQTKFANNLRELRSKYGEQQVLEFLDISRGSFYNYLKGVNKKISWHQSLMVTLALEANYQSLEQVKSEVLINLDYQRITEMKQRAHAFKEVEENNKVLNARIEEIENSNELLKQLNECEGKNKSLEDQIKWGGSHLNRMKELLHEANGLNDMLLHQRKF